VSRRPRCRQERLRRERAKEIAKRAERRRLREEAERERIGCKRDTERMQGFELAVAAEAEVRARNARDRRWREQERERGQRLAQLKAKKAKDQRERERVKREECERLIEKEERRQRATGAQRPGAWPMTIFIHDGLSQRLQFLEEMLMPIEYVLDLAVRDP